MSIPEQARTAAVRVLVTVGGVAAFAMLAAIGFMIHLVLGAAMSASSGPPHLVVTGAWFLMLVASGAAMCVAAWLYGLSMRTWRPLTTDKAFLFMDGLLVGLMVLSASGLAGAGADWHRHLPGNPGAVVAFVGAGVFAVAAVLTVGFHIRRSRSAA